MKIKNLLLFAAAASLSVSAFAQDYETGEWAVLDDGSPAMIGQTTADHLFVRNSYNDMGPTKDYTTISFKGGTPQNVKFWLDDDQIYLNEKVQALPKTLIKDDGDPYNEITYNSLQCNIYLPQGVRIVKSENDDGDEIDHLQGARLPNSAQFKFAVGSETKVIDGITYQPYTIIISNQDNNGTHFSAKNARAYQNNGALKKDDAELFTIFLQNDNQAEVEGPLADLIIANQEFGMREPFIVEPKWEPNDYRFIHGTGGNNETQRYQLYTRVPMYGSSSIVEDMSKKTINNVKYVNIAGMESSEPFEGVNIKVTTYNDGTTSTCKVMK